MQKPSLDAIEEMRRAGAAGARSVCWDSQIIQDAAEAVLAAYGMLLARDRRIRKPLAWARAVGANKAKDIMRSARRGASDAVDVGESGMPMWPEWEGGRDRQMSEWARALGARREDLAKMLCDESIRLTCQQRRAIELVLGGASFHHAARLASRDRSNFKRTLRRAIRKLWQQRCFRKTGPPPETT